MFVRRPARGGLPIASVQMHESRRLPSPAFRMQRPYQPEGLAHWRKSESICGPSALASACLLSRCSHPTRWERCGLRTATLTPRRCRDNLDAGLRWP